MATKTAAKKTSSAKARSTKSASTSAKKSAPVAKKSTTSKKSTLPVSLYKEQNPENHKLTGKFRVLFAVLAAGLVFFAALSAYLYVYAVNLQDEYQKIDTCARAGIKCETVKNNDVEASETEE